MTDTDGIVKTTLPLNLTDIFSLSNLAQFISLFSIFVSFSQVTFPVVADYIIGTFFTALISSTNSKYNVNFTLT